MHCLIGSIRLARKGPSKSKLNAMARKKRSLTAVSPNGPNLTTHGGSKTQLSDVLAHQTDDHLEERQISRLQRLHEVAASIYLYGSPAPYGGINHYQLLWWYVISEGVMTSALFPMFLLLYGYTQIVSGSMIEEIFFPTDRSLMFFIIALISDFIQDKIALYTSRLEACNCGTDFSRFFSPYKFWRNWEHWNIVAAGNCASFLFFFLVTCLKAMKIAGMGRFSSE